MNNPEFLILILNTVVICIAYFLVYPLFCGSDIVKVAINDGVASAICLLVAGSLFWGSGTEFNLVFLTANWFGFTLLTYLIIELPFMVWYSNKYDIWSSFDP